MLRHDGADDGIDKRSYNTCSHEVEDDEMTIMPISQSIHVDLEQYSARIDKICCFHGQCVFGREGTQYHSNVAKHDVSSVTSCPMQDSRCNGRSMFASELPHR